MDMKALNVIRDEVSTTKYAVEDLEEFFNSHSPSFDHFKKALEVGVYKKYRKLSRCMNRVDDAIQDALLAAEDLEEKLDKLEQ
jgi:hypothetical protein